MMNPKWATERADLSGQELEDFDIFWPTINKAALEFPQIKAELMQLADEASQMLFDGVGRMTVYEFVLVELTNIKRTGRADNIAWNAKWIGGE